MAYNCTLAMTSHFEFWENFNWKNHGRIWADFIFTPGAAVDFQVFGWHVTPVTTGAIWMPDAKRYGTKNPGHTVSSESVPLDSLTRIDSGAGRVTSDRGTPYSFKF